MMKRGAPNPHCLLQLPMTKFCKTASIAWSFGTHTRVPRDCSSQPLVQRLLCGVLRQRRLRRPRVLRRRPHLQGQVPDRQAEATACTGSSQVRQPAGMQVHAAASSTVQCTSDLSRDGCTPGLQCLAPTRKAGRPSAAPRAQRASWASARPAGVAPTPVATRSSTKSGTMPWASASAPQVRPAGLLGTTCSLPADHLADGSAGGQPGQRLPLPPAVRLLPNLGPGTWEHRLPHLHVWSQI